MNIAILFTGRCEAVSFVGREHVLHRETAVAQRDHDLVRLAPCSRADRWRPAPPCSGVLILSAEFSGERSFIHALPSGVPGSAMRAYISLAAGLPIRRNRFQQRDQVRRSDDIDRRRGTDPA